MPSKLREKYGGTTAQAINRAIRAECPGGAAALDALETAFRRARRLGWETDRGPTPMAEAYIDVLGIVDAMEDWVRDRYGLAPADRDDLDRSNHRRGGRC